MFRNLHIVLSIGFLLVLSVGCDLVSPQARSFENETVAFTIPAGWQTMEEVWDRPATLDKDYYGLGLPELVMIQYPPEQGAGKVFFAVASAPLAEGEDLESRFNQAYALAVPEIEELSRQPYALGELSGYEITYRRPWGEPWWNFRDIWLEKDGVIYLLSFHATPNSFETYKDTFEEIIASVIIKD
jgi:hypothetical protein